MGCAEPIVIKKLYLARNLSSISRHLVLADEEADFSLLSDI